MGVVVLAFVMNCLSNRTKKGGRYGLRDCGFGRDSIGIRDCLFNAENIEEGEKNGTRHRDFGCHRFGVGDYLLESANMRILCKMIWRYHRPFR